MAKIPDPINSLAEATSIRMQRLEEAVKEADARLTARLDTLTEQVGRMTEGITALQEETRLTQQIMRETHQRTQDLLQHNHDQLYSMLQQQWAQQHETTMRLTGIIDTLLQRSA